MNELTKPIKDIIDRGKDAQRKTIDGISEFSLCVVELKSEATVISGGSDFGQLCKVEWGISPETASYFIRVGLKNKKLFVRAENLPANIRSLSYLCTLDDNLRDKILDEGTIDAGSTRDDIQALQRRLTLKPKEVPTKKQLNDEKENIKAEKEIKAKSAAAGKAAMDNWSKTWTSDEVKREKGKVVKSISKMSKREALSIIGIDGESILKESLEILCKGLLHKYHPDKPGGNKDKFQSINKAREVLNEQS